VFGTRWRRPDRIDDEALDTADISDLAAGFEAVRSIRSIPAGLDTFVPLVVAAGLPWLAVVLTQVPLLDLLNALTQALL